MLLAAVCGKIMVFWDLRKALFVLSMKMRQLLWCKSIVSRLNVMPKVMRCIFNMRKMGIIMSYGMLTAKP